MASRSTLIALTVVAVALAAVVALDTKAPGGSTGGGARLLPELRHHELERLTIRRSNEIVLELERARDGALVLARSPATVLDSRAVADLAATLELLSYRRRIAEGAARERDAERGLEPPRLLVEIGLDGGETVQLRLGARLDAADQVWLKRSGRDSTYLVAGYAARALDRSAEELRSRRPFQARASRVTGVELHAGERSLVLSGQPLAVHPSSGGGAVRADPARVAELLRLLDDLRIRRFVDAPAATPDAGALSVRVLGALPAQELEEVGPCPDRAGERVITSPVGAGCVDAGQLDAIAAYAGAGAELFDRRLIGAEAPRQISFADAGKAWTLRRRGQRWQLVGEGLEPQADAREADSGAVREWLDALDRLATGEISPRPTGPGREGLLSAITFTYADGRRIVLGLSAPTRSTLAVRRGDEPVLWQVGAEARVLFEPRPWQFQPRQLLSLEPYALRSARSWRGGRLAEHVERGELLEEWHVRAPADARAYLPAVAQLREAGSHLRAVQFVASKPTPRHGLTPPRARVELVFDPPPVGDTGPEEVVRHRIELGSDTGAGGCYAQLDPSDAVFELERDQCRSLLGPWTVSR